MSGELELLRYAKDDIEKLERRVAELEQQLADTKQYLAVADGLSEGGPPGWKMDTSWMRALYPTNTWYYSNAVSPYIIYVCRRTFPPWDWHVVMKGDIKVKSGTAPTAHEAMAAAEAAYQEAIAQGGQ
jgi:hypothetical protein